MAEVILDRAEFLVLLDAMRVLTVAGINAQELISESIDEHRQMIDQGQQLLQQRGLLQVAPDGVRVIDQLLLMMAQVVTQPEIALISVRETPNIGQQLFLHYTVDDYVVEQTFPVEGQHRLATLPNLDGLFDRLLTIFPVQDKADATAVGELSQDDFLAAKADADEGRQEQARAAFVRAGFSEDNAALLTEAFAAPIFGGTVALLRCADEEIMDARNPAIVQGPRAAWSIAQAVPGEPRLRITRVDAARLREQFVGWFGELKAVSDLAQ